jgi:hypothetical protein
MSELELAARTWLPRILAELADSAQVRIPLAMFYSSSLRRALDVELAGRGRSLQWNEARQSLDDAGHVVRVVPVAVRASHDSVDDHWDDA